MKKDIKELEKEENIIPDSFMNDCKCYGDLRKELCKYKGILKIKKHNQLYNLIQGNKNLYVESISADDILLYYVFNVKSDYYLAKYENMLS